MKHKLSCLRLWNILKTSKVSEMRVFFEAGGEDLSDLLIFNLALM